MVKTRNSVRGNARQVNLGTSHVNHKVNSNPALVQPIPSQRQGVTYCLVLPTTNNSLSSQSCGHLPVTRCKKLAYLLHMQGVTCVRFQPRRCCHYFTLLYRPVIEDCSLNNGLHAFMNATEIPFKTRRSLRRLDRLYRVLLFTQMLST